MLSCSGTCLPYTVYDPRRLRIAKKPNVFNRSIPRNDIVYADVLRTGVFFSPPFLCHCFLLTRDKKSTNNKGGRLAVDFDRLIERKRRKKSTPGPRPAAANPIPVRGHGRFAPLAYSPSPALVDGTSCRRTACASPTPTAVGSTATLAKFCFSFCYRVWPAV